MGSGGTEQIGNRGGSAAIRHVDKVDPGHHLEQFTGDMLIAPDCRFRAGLRDQRLVWHRGAQEYAGRDHRQAERGDQRSTRRSEDEGALSDLGGIPLPGSSADFAKFIANETEKWGKVIRAAGIKPE
jgi:hypothetical protein